MTRVPFAPTALALSLLALAGGSALAADAPAPEAKPPYTLTGHIDLVSRYYLRGATLTYGNTDVGVVGNALADAPESDKAALQWGADYVHSEGFYAGYWGSQINYSYDRLGKSWSDRTVSEFQSKKSIENDFYAGYSGAFGDLGYTIGGTYYYYINGTASNAPETKLGLSYGPVALNAQTLLKDTVWGNKGDTYWTLVYTQPVAYDITFTANLGFYTYKKEGQYLGTKDTFLGTTCAAGTAFNVNGCYAGNQPKGGAFRHLVLGIAQPIASTSLTWSLQGIIAGKNRFDVKQDNKIVASIVYGF